MRPALSSRLIIALIVAGLLLAFGPQMTLIPPARAADPILVTVANDEDTANGVCSLREAVKAAAADANYRGCIASSGADTIDFDPSVFNADTTITLTSQITIDSGLTIQNTSGHKVTLERASGGFLKVTTTSNVVVENLTMQNTTVTGAIAKTSTSGNLTLDGVILQGIDNTNSPGSGNLINSAGGTLYIQNSTFYNNLNAPATLGTGGLIKSDGPIVIYGTTFEQNANVTGSGHNLASGGVIYGKSDVTIYNSTFSNNSNPESGTAGTGGVVYVDAGTLKVVNVTFYNNGNASGGASSGRVLGWKNTGVTATIDNTIILNSPVGKVCTTSPAATVHSNSNFADSTCGGTDPTTLTHFDTTLDFHGGPTKTHEITYGSSAIDAGDNTAASNLGITTDQRGGGFERPHPSAGTVDIGAFEFQGSPDIEVSDSTPTVIDDGTGAFTFPGTTPGTPVQETFSIKNTGTADLNVSNINLPGSGFSLVGSFPSSPISPSDSASFTVQCDAASVGTYTLTLTFDTNVASPADEFSFGLTCAVGVREITVIQNNKERPSGFQVNFRHDQTITFTVRNDGGGTGSESVLHLSPVDLSGDDYALTSDIGTTTLNPGDSTTFSVTCTSDTDKHVQGQIRLGSDDSDEDPYVFPLDCADYVGNHEAEPAAAPVDVSNFFCSNLSGQTGGAMTGSAGQSVLNNVIGDIYCTPLVQDGVMGPNSAAAIGDADVLQKGVIQAVNVYGLLPGGAPTDTFVAPVQICLRGSGPVLWLHFDPVAQQRVVTVLPSTESGGYSCADVPGAGVVVLDGPVAGSSEPASAPAAPTQPPSNALNNCTVTTLYAARLRAEPNTSSDILATVPYNLSLQATESVDGWYRVIFGSQQGWISAELLSTAGECGP